MRLRLIKNFILFFFSVLIVSLWYMQCIEGSRYLELSQKNRIRIVPLTAPRGNIYDRNMKILASSRLAFNCAVIPQEFRVSDERLRELGGIIELSVEDIRKRIREEAIAPFAPVVLRKDIGKEIAIAISERSIDFPGLIIQIYPTRYYPNGSVSSHVIGYLGKISEEELSALRYYGYKVRDFVGRAGLEMIYDSYLRGEDGGMQTEVDSRGRELRVLGIREPEKGKDLVVSIDIELEKYVDSLLEGTKGAAVVMDVETGEILCLVSKPDYDPNIFVSYTEPELINDLLQRVDYPLVDRAIGGTYPPGSVFKIVTASAALESKKIDEREKLNCSGSYILGNRQFNCWKKTGHSDQTITEGIKNSCNVFFFQLGRRVGVSPLTDYAMQYGFGRETEIDLPYEAGGIVPSKSWKARYKRSSWYEGDTLNYAIGQGYISVTPLQILRMVNAVAADGELIRPFLARRIEDVEIDLSRKRQIGISRGTYRVIREGMRKAVEDSDGTAMRARVPDLEIAGKTGTAQTAADETHAWFSGFSPVDKPKKSLVVFLEHGGKGGDKPSTIAASIFGKLKELGYL